jgi:hypothetical protein
LRQPLAAEVHTRHANAGPEEGKRGGETVVAEPHHRD